MKDYEKIHAVQDALKPILIDWGSGDGMSSLDVEKFIDALADAVAERLDVECIDSIAKAKVSVKRAQ